jgi:hypothetical protein
MAEQNQEDITWRDFLRSYAAGDCETFTGGIGHPCSPPSRGSLPHLKHLKSDYHGELPKPLYESSTDIDIDTARKVRAFYEETGFLAPPRSPSELLRIRCAKDYELTRPAQMANIQMATDLVALHFPSAIITFSLYLDDAQHHVAAAGSPESIKHLALDIGTRVPPHVSLCGHAILQHKGLHFVPDLASDWRFRGNPWVRGGTKSYIGISVNLPPNPGTLLTSFELPEKTVSIGTLNVLFVDHHLDQVTPAQTKYLEHIAHILEEQLRSTWLGKRHLKEFRAREIVLDYLENSLVNRHSKGDADNLPLDSSTIGTSVSSPAKLQIEIPVEAQHAVDKMRTVLECAEYIGIIDVSLLGIHETVSISACRGFARILLISKSDSDSSHV